MFKIADTHWLVKLNCLVKFLANEIMFDSAKINFAFLTKNLSKSKIIFKGSMNSILTVMILVHPLLNRFFGSISACVKCNYFMLKEKNENFAFDF